MNLSLCTGALLEAMTTLGGNAWILQVGTFHNYERAKVILENYQVAVEFKPELGPCGWKLYNEKGGFESKGDNSL